LIGRHSEGGRFFYGSHRDDAFSTSLAGIGLNVRHRKGKESKLLEDTQIQRETGPHIRGRFERKKLLFVIEGECPKMSSV